MFAVDFCGCMSYEGPRTWLIEVDLKRWYDARVVAEMTYKNRPSWGFIPTRAARANVPRRHHTWPTETSAG
jgi:hypothetical protein